VGTPPPQPDISIYKTDAEIGGALKPGWMGVYTGQFVEVNSMGFRGPELSTKELDEFRVGIVGDSFAFGWGVSDEETVSANLEEAWREIETSTRTLTAINAGVPGYNLIQEASWCLTQGLDPDLGLDLAIFLVVPNDLEDPLIYPPLSGEEAERELKWHNEVRHDPRVIDLPGRKTFRTINLLNRLLQNTLPSQKDLAEDFYRFYSAKLFQSDNWPKTQKALLKMNSEFEQVHLDFVLVLYPIPHRLDAHPFEAFHRTISNWCGEVGISCYDPWNLWKDIPASELILHPEDMHPNAKYHELMGEYLLDQVVVPRFSGALN